VGALLAEPVRDLSPVGYVPSAQEWRLRTADLDGNGSNEVLFAAAFPHPHGSGHPEREELFCFSPDGKLRWQ